MSNGFLPWQVDTARSWLQKGDRLAHAWLIHGQAGIGKRSFGLGLATSLLCEAPIDHMACGQCPACVWVRLGNHPDLMRVRPDAMASQEGITLEAEEQGTASVRAVSGKPSEIIRVEQIRALEPWYHRTTHRAGWRIVLLYPVEKMMAESANALLKALEEPPSNTLFLLISDSPDNLLATIVSRCQKLKMPVPETMQATTWLATQGLAEPDAWLAVAGGAPLKALELSASQTHPYPDWIARLVEQMAHGKPLATSEIAEEIAQGTASEWLGNLQRLCIDLSLVCAGLAPRYFIGLKSALSRISAQRTLKDWAALEQWISRQTSLAQHPLNAKLFSLACLQKFTTA